MQVRFAHYRIEKLAVLRAVRVALMSDAAFEVVGRKVLGNRSDLFVTTWIISRGHPCRTRTVLQTLDVSFAQLGDGKRVLTCSTAKRVQDRVSQTTGSLRSFAELLYTSI